MMTSISTCFSYQIPIFEQIPAIAECGFSHLSLSGNLHHFDYRKPENRNKLKDTLCSYKLKMDTIHGGSLEKVNSLNELRAVINAAMDLGTHAIVIHPVPFDVDAAEYASIRERLLCHAKEITHIARDYPSINIAVENVMPGKASDLTEMIVTEVNESNVGFCYDSSHEQVDGPNPYTLIAKYGKQLKAVHISDRSAPFVDHQLPGQGFVDFDRIATELRNLDFCQPLLLEVMMEHSSFTDVNLFLIEASKAARNIFRKINGHNKRLNRALGFQG